MTTTTSGSTDTTAYPAPAPSMARLFRDRVEATPDTEAYRFPRGEAWQSVTWAETEATVTRLAAGLLALGVRPEERVAIVSSTRMEWVYADLASMCAGAATTTVYPNTGAAGIAYILSDSGTRVVFAEDDDQVAKVLAHRDQLPDLVKVVTFAGTGDGDQVITLDDLSALGAELLASRPTAVEEAVDQVRPEHLATLIYTSGTTGPPKGVELTHSCWTYIAASATTLDLLRPDDLQYLWLPLSHAFGKMLEVVQLQVGFPTVVDGRLDKIVDNLAEVRPTFMAGPPRIYEKVHSKVVQTVGEEGGLRLRLFGWAFGVGSRVSEAGRAGRPLGRLERLEARVADRLVLSKIRARLGGRIRFLVSGSAALSSDVASWFHAAGIPVLEGYGLTETSSGTSIVRLDELEFGLVGRPLAGTEVRIAPDGEVLTRGPGVMRGYHHRPEETAAVLDAEGWFATGDIGHLDVRGRLHITDRKKDLIKTSGGKYIAPQPIEVTFKALCPLASQMVVHGDGRNYATALVTLDAEALAQWAQARGLGETSYEQLVVRPDVEAEVRTAVERLNERLDRWETVKDFRVLDHDLTVEAGELTPSMKVKRKVVESRYADLFDQMYAGAGRG